MCACTHYFTCASCAKRNAMPATQPPRIPSPYAPGGRRIHSDTPSPAFKRKVEMDEYYRKYDS